MKVLEFNKAVKAEKNLVSCSVDFCGNDISFLETANSSGQEKALAYCKKHFDNQTDVKVVARDRGA